MKQVWELNKEEVLTVEMLNTILDKLPLSTKVVNVYGNFVNTIVFEDGTVCLWRKATD